MRKRLRMHKYIYIGTLMMLTYTAIFAQKQNSLRMVELPNSAKVILMEYLKRKEKLSDDNDSGVYVFNLQNPKDTKYKDGIYTFRLMGPHFRRRVFIVNGLNINIFNSQYIDDFIEEFNSFMKKSSLPTKKKIEYLKSVSNFLEEEYNTENS